jgi:hypothetical protein
MMGVLASSELPALPLHTAGKYVAGAYVVFFAIVLIYVAIMAVRLKRIERDVSDLISQQSAVGADRVDLGDRESTPV